MNQTKATHIQSSPARLSLIEGEAADAESAKQASPTTSLADQLGMESCAKLAAIVEFADDAIISDSLDGAIISWNQGAERMYGYSAEEVLGRTTSFLLPAHRAQESQDMLATVLRGEPLRHFETDRLRKDGQQICISLSVSPVKAADGTIIGLSKIARDISESRAIQAERDRLLAQLRRQIDRMPLACILMDAEGRVVDWNPAAEKVFGYTREEALGQAGIDLIVPLPRDSQLQEPVRRIWAGDMNVPCANENRTKDGRILTCEWLNAPLHDASGRVDGIISLAQDVTERQRTVAALEERMRQAMFAAEVGVILTRHEDLRSTLQSCCECIVKHIGVVLARIWTLDAEQNVRELQASAGLYNDLDGMHIRLPAGQLMIGQIAEQRRPHFEMIDDPRLGDQEWAKGEGMVAFAGYPLICQDRVVGVLAMFSRETLTEAAMKAIGAVSAAIAAGIERFHVIEQLRTSEERFDLAVRGSSDTVWDWNIQTGAVYFSPRFNEMLAYEKGKLESQFATFEALLHPDDRPQVIHLIDKHLKERAPFGTEFRLRAKGGEYRWFYSRGQALWNCEGIAYRMAGSITDVTERKQMERVLAQRDEQLRQSQKLEAVGSLAGGIAHEFNNMLQAICGFTNFALASLPPDGACSQDLQQVLKAADRGATLTRQLLGFSRRQVLERITIDCREVVLDLIAMLRPLIGEHIEVVASASDDVGTVHADRGLLQQLLINLCINSRDAMPNGGRLILKTERIEISREYCDCHPSAKPGSYVLFSVSDSGCGMPPEVKERIFEPFFTTKEVGQGTGLGLATVYGIVQQHDGLINVYSQPGVGTTFKVYLPAAAGPATCRNVQALTPIRGGGETILLAEDEPMVREMTVRILSRAGYSLLIAADGAEAVAQYEANSDRISLVLLDAIMPKLSGRQVYDRVTLHNPDLPIIFCSGYDPQTSQLSFLLSKGLRLVQKPFDPDTLLRAVRNCLDTVDQLHANPGNA